jgi:HSP20 family protein
VRPEDIELTVDQNTLTIRGRYSQQNDHENQAQGQQQQGQQQQSQAQSNQPNQQQATQQDGGQQAQQDNKTGRHRRGHNWLSREIVSGSFERSITFPRPIDTNNVQTKFQNGILTIMLPVSEASRPKRISITGDQSQPQQVPVEAGQSRR